METGLLNTTEQNNIEWPDILALALYFVLILGVGIGASSRAKTSTSQGYFLAGRSMNWILIGASTFSTNVGAPMFIGIAGTSAVSGIAIIMFEWHAMWMLILLGWVFLPVYTASGCYTMPQYLKLRYGGQRIRVWLAIIHTILCIIAAISGQMYAGALFVQRIFDWNLYAAVGVILAITAVYTVIGGLTAVIWTDTIQTIILIIGATILSIIGLVRIGGFESMRNQYMMSAATETVYDVALHGNRTCGLPRDDAFHIFRSHDADFPWPGMVFGLTLLALNAWCTDQICVQRSLSAKSVTHAKAGVLLAAYLKFLPFFFFVIPGMLSRIFHTDKVACADPVKCYEICQNPNGCSDIAYPELVLNLLPTGVKGVMLAALLSALMSSLTSYFNSSSTVFTMDIWKRCRPKATEDELMVVSRIWTLVLVGVSIAWLPILQEIRGSQYWNYTQSISSYITPPIVVVFLMGIFWTRATEKGAFCGLVGGLGIGVIRMGLAWSRSAQPCGSNEPDNQFDIISRVHYMHFAIILAACVAIIVVSVSLMTEPRPPNKLRRVTFWTRHDKNLPDVSDDSDDEDDEEDEEGEKEKRKPEPSHEPKPQATCCQAAKDFFLKWLCGVEKKMSRTKLTKQQVIAMQLKHRDIKEDPFWARVLNVNAVICAFVAFFIHGFWA